MAVFRVVTVDSDDEVAYPASRDILKILTSGTIGAAVPAYVGQTAINTTDGLLYRANGTDAGDWEPHGSVRTLSALTDVSFYEGEVAKYGSVYFLSTAAGTDSWQPHIGAPYASVTYAATIATDASAVGMRTTLAITLTGNLTLNVPTNGTAGQRLRYHLLASGGARTVTRNAALKIPDGATFNGTIDNGDLLVLELEFHGAAWYVTKNLTFTP